MNISEFIKRLEVLQSRLNTIPAAIDECVEQNKEVLLSLNRDQMLLGRDASGDVLTPSYTEDPFFKSKKAAEAYAQMKYRLEGHHKSLISHALNYTKDKNTPNLIVTGPYQDSMFITTGGGSHTIGATYQEATDIEQKYRNNLYGLAPLSKEYFWKHYLLIHLMRHIWGATV